MKDKILYHNKTIEYYLALFRCYLSEVLKKHNGLNKLMREEKVVVSLTTYPRRFDIVHLTIETLLNQTIKPDDIVLWLSKREVNIGMIPSKLVNLEKRGLTIKYVDENLKSYKKLIYALDEYKNSLIITCDDDILYPSWFVEGLFNTYKQHPSCVVAYRCSYMVKSDSDKLAPYLSWKTPISKGPSFNLFPTGVGGILYPANILHTDFFKKDLFLDLSPSSDDIWFKAMALLNGVKTVMVNCESIEFPMIRGSQNEALWKINVMQNKNDQQLKKVMDFYQLYDRIE